MARTSVYLSDKFQHYFAQYAATLRNERTEAEYRGAVSLLCDYAKKDFLAITEQDADTYFHYLTKRVIEGSLKNTTLNGRLYILKQVASYISETFPEANYKNPFLLVQPERGIKNNIKPSSIPSLAEIDLFLSHVESPMYYLIFCMAFRIALSAMDILSLKLSIVQKFDDSYCLHYPPQDRFTPDRVVVLPKDIEELLLNYIANMSYVDDKGHLFYNKHHNPLTPRNLDACFERTLKASGIEAKYTLKDFRSRGILDMVNAALKSDTDISSVGSYVGIKDLRLNTYASANTIVGDCPANLVNFSVKSADMKEE